MTTATDGAPRARPPLIERTVLDEQIRTAQQTAPQAWGVRSWLGPLVGLAALIVGSGFVSGALPDRGTGRTIGVAALSIGLELVLLAVLVAFGRPLAARGGGWRQTLGLDRVRRSDWLPWITGVGFAYLGRTVVSVIALALTGGRALAEASNLTGGDGSVVSIVVLVVVAVVLAPIAEELMFRGLLLRSFMHRMSFWPAAGLSTFLFGAFHVYEVDTVAGAVTLACSVGVLGLVNCHLVRITGRLTPGIMVHATCNALAVAVVLLLS
ncbi:CPBP family intramembrane glutamic endopeptidase [Modestobacter altitudinis]|uniref:CPBP family intramembrane glutamic endopeptidase n=1 Tax=Modestobacter altitudinis TaxID=2213158 RepID=UPI00110CC338|nr:CPBP family intramembrane glutamic endopeptidase [Modestobacter altitudinis]